MQTIKLFLFFLFNSIFAFLASLYIHEFGHAIFVRVLLGIKPTIKMNPLTGGVTIYSNLPTTEVNKMLIAGGGLIVGVVIGLIVAIVILRCFKSAWSSPFLLSGIGCIGVNALMAIAGLILFSSGDVTKLVAFGVPKWILISSGGVVLIICFYIFVLSMPFFGLVKNSSLVKRIVVIAGSVLVYSIVILVYHFVSQKGNVALYVRYVGIVLFALMLGILAAHYIGKYIIKKELDICVLWRHVGFSFVLAVGAMAVVCGSSLFY